jgi:3-deoxy-D-manno-octulosonate 8-phosphate phosphatase (KDO 8-P phosphatase)
MDAAPPPSARPGVPAPRPLGTPAARFDAEVLLQAMGPGLGIKAAIFDVDGVLTDGRIYVGEHGETVKAFSTLDGQGLKMLSRCGIAPVVITGRDSTAVRRRVAELGIAHACYGIEDKLAAAVPVLAALGAGWDETAAIGDDWPDLPLLLRAGFACAPAQAHPEVRAAVHHVTTAPGGHGAAREFCDLLLTAAGRYAGLLQAQLGPLDRP